MSERSPFDEQGLGLGSNEYDQYGADDPLFGARSERYIPPEPYSPPAGARFDPMTGEPLSAEEQPAAPEQTYHPDPQYASHEQYTPQNQNPLEHDYEQPSSFLGEDDYDDEPVVRTSGGGGRRRARAKKKKNRGKSCLAVIVALALLVGGGWFAFNKGMNALDGFFADAPDYSGPGSGSVMVEVKSGDSAAAIGRTLKTAGVVASVDAFIDAASQNPDAAGIQAGHYELKKKMKAADALAVLIDPDNVVANGVTIPEGYTVDQTIGRIAEKTEFKEPALRAILKKRTGLGLPAYAEGNPEGLLYPSTYDVTPGMTAADLLKAMVTEFKKQAGSKVKKASSVDLTEYELVIAASLVEKEGKRTKDLAGVAEVILNRLSGDCQAQGVPNELLQLDSTVHYAEGDNGSVFTSDEMRNSDSAYNTYNEPGLPPGPIAAPSIRAIDAMLNPTDEGYCYFVAVNLKTGETLFSQGESEHHDNKAKLDEWCADNPDYNC